MQICMKLQAQPLSKLQVSIKERFEKSGLKAAVIAERSNVDQGQTSRILRGDFKTLSANVMQICNILEIDYSEFSKSRPMMEDAKGAISRSALELWDGSAEGADALMRLFAQMSRLGIPKKQSSRQK